MKGPLRPRYHVLSGRLWTLWDKLVICLSGRDWWRGLDSNQCSLRRQIYSLMDLTTLPPLHISR